MDVAWDERAFADEVLEPLKAGDVRAIEPALAFLEADPWAFRSGYAKGKALRHLSHHDLDAQQRRRLERVLVHHVDAGDRLEFRWSCRLAARLGASSLPEQLVARLASGDRRRARRAVVMLAALQGARLDRQAIDQARQVIGELALRQRHPNDERLVRELAVRFWSLAWERRLLDAAEGDEPGRRAALAVLRALPRVHGADHEARLAAAVRRARILDRA